MSEFAELLDFLRSDRLDVREEALKVLLHLLQPENSSSFNTNEMVLLLLNLMKVPALSLLVMNVFNVMIANGVQEILHAEQILSISLAYLLTSTNATIIHISLILLTNLTTVSLDNTELLTEKIFANPLIFNQLLGHFLAHNPQAESAEPSADGSEFELDPWQYFGSVLCNLCQKEKVQLHLLNKSSGYLSSLTKQVPHLPCPALLLSLTVGCLSFRFVPRTLCGDEVLLAA
jgi:hypothetical protein